jgi:uncharacterized membrane protein YhaH (DUF805 family)
MFGVLRDMWGEWAGGRLPPRRFALLYVCTWLFLLIVCLLGFALGATMFGEHGKPHSSVAGDFAGILGLGMLLWFAALFNISVKRGRDIGVPGFVAGILFLVGLVVGGGSIFASLLLALIPSDTVAGGRG